MLRTCIVSHLTAACQKSNLNGLHGCDADGVGRGVTLLKLLLATATGERCLISTIDGLGMGFYHSKGMPRITNFQLTAGPRILIQSRPSFSFPSLRLLYSVKKKTPGVPGSDFPHSRQVWCISVGRAEVQG